MLPEDVKVQFPDGQTVILRTVEDSSLTFYANNATFSMTQWDICVNLNEILITKITEPDDKSPGSVVVSVSRKAKVLLNVAYAKQFAEVLLKHIEQHENIGKQAALESAKEQSAATPQPKPD